MSGENLGSLSRPTGLGKPHVPLTIVCGPPGSGKSTYVAERAKPTDTVICFDRIAKKIFGDRGSVRTRVSLSQSELWLVLRVRNEELRRLMKPKASTRWTAAWLIVSEPKGEHRMWWSTTCDAQVIVMLTPPGVCKGRILDDAQRGDRRGDGAMRFVDEWWQRYTPAECDRIIR